MLKLRDIMTRDVATCAPDLSIRGAIALLARRRVGCAPVIVGQRVAGIISLSDLARCAASLLAPALDHRGDARRIEQASPAGDPDYADQCFFTELWSDAGADAAELLDVVSGPEGSVLEEHTVAEFMSRGVTSMAPDISAREAATLMTVERIHRIVVMDGDRLVGIVSLTDIARAAAEHRLSTRAFIAPSEMDFAECGAECAAW